MPWSDILFEIAKGTEFEPEQEVQFICLMPDPFLQYKGTVFAIGADNELWVKEDGHWRKARSKSDRED